MREFGYARPTDIAEAVALTYADAHARYLGGGTNLVDLMKLGVETPSLLVDVTGLPLGQVEETAGSSLRIGALARNSDIAVDPFVRGRFPLLSEALLSGASGQLRNVATAGGNLLQRTRCAYFTDVSKPCNKREPGAGCAALDGEHHNHAILGASEHCIATHPSDFAVALAALDARLEVQSEEGLREMALTDFYLPVGDSPHEEVALEHGELITAILVPAVPAAARSRYRKVRERASYAFAICSVAVVVTVVDDAIHDVRIALGAMASRPWRARRAEAALAGSTPSAGSFAAAAELELEQASPLRDNAYKVPLVRELVVDSLCELTGVSR
ncbi:MAG: xanthine dehydrogenase family protein subunit M [Nocardioidaceae bacterium]|nr:xanthine dehydrogenase family protein subunit M [Nocardioidaceae bacterium]